MGHGMQIDGGRRAGDAQPLVEGGCTALGQPAVVDEDQRGRVLVDQPQEVIEKRGPDTLLGEE